MCKKNLKLYKILLIAIGLILQLTFFQKFVFADCKPGSTCFVLISDVDDTVKITAVKKTTSVAENALGTNEFFGSSELYNLFFAEGVNRDVYYVSGAPGPVITLALKFLRNNGFPNATRTSDRIFNKSTESTKAFKIKKISEIIRNLLKTHPNIVFILIGDNGEDDSAAFKEIASQLTLPAEQLHAFVRYIYRPSETNLNVSLSEYANRHQIPFFTTAELAIQLQRIGVITQAQAQAFIDKSTKALETAVRHYHAASSATAASEDDAEMAEETQPNMDNKFYRNWMKGYQSLAPETRWPAETTTMGLPPAFKTALCGLYNKKTANYNKTTIKRLKIFTKPRAFIDSCPCARPDDRSPLCVTD